MAAPRAAARLVLFVALTGGLLPVYLAAYALGRRGRRAVAVLWFEGAKAICGLRVRYCGAISPDRPTLFVANHASYLDVLVLGARLDGAFVSKAEVAGWPVFGFLARLAGTVFVSRRRADAGRQRAQLAERIAAGRSLIVFPEGTSSDGARVLPFRSALFDVARDAPRPLTVQPVSIAYVVDGEERDRYAWYGDMDFAPHLLGVFAGRGVTVEVALHAPVPAAAFADRKALARHCESEVAHGLAVHLRRRLPLVAAWAPVSPPGGEATVYSIN